MWRIGTDYASEYVVPIRVRAELGEQRRTRGATQGRDLRERIRDYATARRYHHAAGAAPCVSRCGVYDAADRLRETLGRLSVRSRRSDGSAAHLGDLQQTC